MVGHGLQTVGCRLLGFGSGRGTPALGVIVIHMFVTRQHDIPKHAWVAHMRIVGVRHDKADHGQDDASKRKRVPFVFDEVVSDAMAQLRKELVKVIHRHDYENLLSARA